jgi:pyruvate/2-oxoglutarate dehydrogenase complex dihydrolipoamide acyltransferase (E2) component
LGFSFGLVAKRPMVGENDEILVKTCFDLVMNFDRRVMAGAPAAKFFARVVSLLEHADNELTGAGAGRVGEEPRD